MNTLQILPMYTPEQCEALAKRVVHQSPFMIKRGEGFYTLGAST